MVRVALADAPAMRPATREWVWELSHHDYFVAGGGACNGRTLADRRANGAGFLSYAVNRGAADVTAVFQSWITSASACPILMSTAHTQVSVSVAYDVRRSYVVVLK